MNLTCMGVAVFFHIGLLMKSLFTILKWALIWSNVAVEYTQKYAIKSISEHHNIISTSHYL
jgi:hypothetical protein